MDGQMSVPEWQGCFLYRTMYICVCKGGGSGSCLGNSSLCSLTWYPDYCPTEPAYSWTILTGSQRTEPAYSWTILTGSQRTELR